MIPKYNNYIGNRTRDLLFKIYFFTGAQRLSYNFIKILVMLSAKDLLKRFTQLSH